MITLWNKVRSLFIGETKPTSTRAPLQYWRRVSDSAIEVDLDVDQYRAYDNLLLERESGSGLVRIELIEDRLFVDQTEIVLEQAGRNEISTDVEGPWTPHRLQGKQALHLNIILALNSNRHLFPESWRYDEDGRGRAVHFLGFYFPDTWERLRTSCWVYIGYEWRKGGGVRSPGGSALCSRFVPVRSS